MKQLEYLRVAKVESMVVASRRPVNLGSHWSHTVNECQTMRTQHFVHCDTAP
jgi:hypothetical protein